MTAREMGDFAAKINKYYRLVDSADSLADRGETFNASYLLQEAKRTDRELYKEARRVLEYVETIEDPYIRVICRMHYVCGRSWKDVAEALGGDNTKDGIRMLARRYLLKMESETQ